MKSETKKLNSISHRNFFFKFSTIGLKSYSERVTEDIRQEVRATDRTKERDIQSVLFG